MYLCTRLDNHTVPTYNIKRGGTIMDYTECRPGNHNPMSLCEQCPNKDNCPAQGEVKNDDKQTTPD